MSSFTTPFDELCQRIYIFPQTTLNPIANIYVDSDGLFIVEGQMWSSIIQYLYYKKFMFDNNAMENILSIHDVGELVHKFGGNLPPSRQSLWVVMRDSVLKRAIYAKFEQNIKLYFMLINLSESALMNIPDDVVFKDQTIKLETDTTWLLIEVKEYFKKYGHPLVDTRFGEYRPKIKELMKKYQTQK